jgi:uncharacterized DUF497 family protein
LPYNATTGRGDRIDVEIIWDLDDDPDGNVQHIAEHGITVEDVQDVLSDPDASEAESWSSGRSIMFGETTDGRYIAVVWELAFDDPRTIYPVTAYPVTKPRRRR